MQKLHPEVDLRCRICTLRSTSGCRTYILRPTSDGWVVLNGTNHLSLYCEYKIEILLRNLVMTILPLQNYQLLKLQLDQMTSMLQSIFTKW